MGKVLIWIHPAEWIKERIEIFQKSQTITAGRIQVRRILRESCMETPGKIQERIKEVIGMAEMDCVKVDVRKVAVIGCGFVGSSIAFTLMQSGLFSEMVLIDADGERAEGEALDISHGTPFARPMKIYAGDYRDITDAAIVIITAGANQKPEESRLDLVNKNTKIMRSVVTQIMGHGCEGILLVVSNPVDILTYEALKISGLPKNRVIGSGTVLDSGRLKSELGEHLGVDSRSIHAFIIGEHGDSEIAVFSSANVSGVPLNDVCEMRGFYRHEAAMREIAQTVKNSAYEIIEKKKATYYGIAMAVRRICEAVVRDEKSILPVSVWLEDIYGLEDVVLSMPAIIGAGGVEGQVPISLSQEEQERLMESAQVLKDTIQKVEKSVC